jgi:hypothetical protein
MFTRSNPIPLVALRRHQQVQVTPPEPHKVPANPTRGLGI